MKYHTAVKFIAILLCAASLLGVVGCAGGIFGLTSLDLYNRSVDQFYNEEVSHKTSIFAHDLAVKYAGEALGGFSEEMLLHHYGQYDPFVYSRYNFTLKDADGNVLLRQHDTDTPVTVYTIPVEGKYMYMLSAVAQRETEPAVWGEETTWDEETTEDALEETIRLEADEAGVPMLMSEADAPAETAAPADTTYTEAAEAADEEAPAEEAEPAEETAPPETIPETVPSTVPETIPETTAPMVPAGDSTPASGDLGMPTNSVPGKPSTINGRPLTDFDIQKWNYYDHQTDTLFRIEYILLDLPAYTVELELADGALPEDQILPLLRPLHAIRNQLFPALAIFALFFAIFAVYLCCAAGRKSKGEAVRAAGLNRVPLELYGGFTIGVLAVAFCAITESAQYVFRQDLLVGCAFTAAVGYAACLVFVGFCFAAAAQLKTPGRFWLTNSLCGHCLRLLIWSWNKFIDGCVWLAGFLSHKVFPLLAKILKSLWQLCRRILTAIIGALRRGFGCVYRAIQKFYALLPMTWQWLVTGFFMVFLLALLCSSRSAFGVFIALLVTIGFVLIGSNAFGILMDATHRMSRGDLNAKIEEKYLIGCFKDFAHNLNALANVAVVAAQRQLKSERMKTELITNVSHDIKTPLTSIINYVDLLQKATTEEERQQYLEVLARQSQQLKKLIEDLIEMSKASTGNLTVDITQLDAVEAVNQALGEFSDKLEKVQLTPIFRHGEDTVTMMADGRLTWRVLHNLLSNAVKYALPGTRLYIDLMQLEGKVILSIKNVSRDELNVDADELMERFVRGDGSRNTEGSGLGLNIAKSMMELQKGSLQLLVDGDLFKVTLIFPSI